MLAALLASSLAPRTACASEPLAGLGTNNFTVLVDTAPFSQSATNLTLSSPFGLGDLVGGQFATIYNWSGITNFGLLMSAPADSPNVGFTIEFYDASLENRINSYQGSATGLTPTPTVVPITISSPGTGDLSSIGGLQFTWDDPSPEGYTDVIEVVGVVPEPSTWALLVLGVALLCLLHRRGVRKAS